VLANQQNHRPLGDAGRLTSLPGSEPSRVIYERSWLMNKVMRIGTLREGRGSLYVRAEYKDGKLSISGVIGPLPTGDALGCCGQIEMEFSHRDPKDDDTRYSQPIKPSEIRFAPGWNVTLWLDLLDIWHRWHMNDTIAGSKVQEDWLREHPVKAVYPESHYEKASQALRDAGLNPDAEGYEYGSAWQREEIPPEVIKQLEAMPETDRKPAWC
jgi:hypothetical protein